MLNLLRKCDEDCRKLLDLLEESAADRPEAAHVEELSEAWPPGQRNHIGGCESCQEAARNLLATRGIFKGVSPATEMARPWFANRVMAAIAARERELSEVASTWLAVPKLASRLAVAAGALLLVASTWLYERPLPAANQQDGSLAAQESLFEPPPPANQDDLLVPVQDDNR